MQKDKAVLLLNLGSPERPEPPEVKKYLCEFLSDPRVLDAPAPIRWWILNVFILPTRPKATAAAYKKVWTDEGSPLIVASEQLQKSVSNDQEVPIELAMRYGNPSIEDTIKRINENNIKELFVIPLYPHYAMSSYETVVVKVQEAIRDIYPTLKTTTLQPFYNHPEYIDALVASSQPYLEKDYDHLLFSFHGIPEHHLRSSDPSKAHCLVVTNCCEVCSPVQSTCYRHQCLQTVKAFVKHANIPKEKYSVSFQSRLGRKPWLQPYTDKVLEELPEKGVKKLLVICPSFVSDCLETIEEISMEGKKEFLKSGGESFEQIPCLNNHPKWIEFINNRIKNWLET